VAVGLIGVLLGGLIGWSTFRFTELRAEERDRKADERRLRDAKFSRIHPWCVARAQLARSGIDPPAVSTVPQALQAETSGGPAATQAHQGHPAFERSSPGDLWQIDATAVCPARPEGERRHPESAEQGEDQQDRDRAVVEVPYFVARIR